MIEIHGLSQSYKKKQVLDSIDLHVGKNELCALVGRNGAGKSTLIHSILGILPIKQGDVVLNGTPLKQKGWKKSVAYLPEKFHLYPHLTGEENMRFFASLDSKNPDEAAIAEKLKQVDLEDAKDVQVKEYSKGMLQRLGLGIMLYYDTEILILDEPTSGLDPMGRQEILRILKGLEDKTILLSSHHMDEIKQICTHVAFLENGKMTKYSVGEFQEKLTAGGEY
ncbi:ABC transporter ATP-binding protein [Bacillus marinisedimentorum]|uniref:ABC transporter ATP-binding protein n=1 Tax=Bacillus marinisedimentorum TaxID=1821260 RepID=UPI000872D104|nr:ABC transporter ATP-binding protein [Bacillus marinisedimentorum]